ncbi:aminoacetone oxidase family FAD-binding enzyme [Leadbetterella sp. DM7]|uniref:aminoacetone oxidase family FAD-binding enzyme n=1 Tax=Leadbetterella sp. DM7 TaxID=3235085 RepID=UPI00349E7BB9
MFDFLVIGGGAAGFFAAINAKKKVPGLKVAILEKQGKVLQKVKVSGGGRCNVTHAVSDPGELARNYPRGGDFLEKAFEKFSSADTRKWFEKRGVALKTEKDGRVFPVSDSSQTIINCFLKEAGGIDLLLHSRVEKITPVPAGWEVQTAEGKVYQTRRLMIATGSDARVWSALQQLDLAFSEAVPSLFTFNIPDGTLTALQGTSFSRARVSVAKTSLVQEGPLLITHWGLSGPAVLKLSAWGAYLLKKTGYIFEIEVNWLADRNKNDLEKELKKRFSENPKKNIRMLPVSGVSQRFWTYICDKSGISEFRKGAEGGKKQIAALLENLTASKFSVNGKSTFKEEFVTAGGVSLDEVNAESFSTCKYPDLYLGGEVLDIDAVTGGFNFQAAWTAGWLISEHIFHNYSI